MSSAPFGTWRSPITPAAVANAGMMSFEQLEAAGEWLYWTEPRSEEDGRSALVRWRPGRHPEDVVPNTYDVRTTVHEYGGRSFAAAADGTVVFSNLPDCRLYRRDPDGSITPLTDAGALRYADPIIDRGRERIICVLEDHSAVGEPQTSLISISLSGGAAATLASGYDFYASPRLSPDGTRLAWVCWRHPNMPWDGTELWTAELDPAGGLTRQGFAAGGRRESVLFPRWSTEGVVHFISDRGGFWHLCRLRDETIVDVAPPDVESGGIPRVLSGGAWDFDAASSRVHYAFSREGVQHLALIEDGAFTEVASPFSFFFAVTGFDERSAVAAAGPQHGFCVALISRDGGVEMVRPPRSSSIPESWFSTPEPVSFATEDGATAHGFLYLPTNPDHDAPRGEKPPLIVNAHGGPVAATFATRSLDLQFYTSRGIAVLDVNYRGSIGYGRRYREALYGRIGDADIDDCIAGARYLAERDLVDPGRVVIRGASAGGYITIAALTFRDFFCAGLSFCGISDLERFELPGGTHKFESHYNVQLVGPYPERADLYRERSPIHFADRINRPLLLLQGLDDHVVPPEQSRLIAESLRQRGIPVALVEFEGEGHGFRRADSLQRFYEAELAFLGRVLNFEPADALPPLPIHNLAVEVTA